RRPRRLHHPGPPLGGREQQRARGAPPPLGPLPPALRPLGRGLPLRWTRALRDVRTRTRPRRRQRRREAPDPPARRPLTPTGVGRTLQSRLARDPAPVIRSGTSNRGGEPWQRQNGPLTSSGKGTWRRATENSRCAAARPPGRSPSPGPPVPNAPT